MTLNTFKCNYLTPLHFKGLTDVTHTHTHTYVHKTAIIVYFTNHTIQLHR